MGYTSLQLQAIAVRGKTSSSFFAINLTVYKRKWGNQLFILSRIFTKQIRKPCHLFK